MSYQRQNVGCPVSVSELDRLCYHMVAVRQYAQSEWVENFALSILKQSRRRNWTPSYKQLSVMRELVSDLFTHAPGADQGGDIRLIED
ncbi:MAG: hypothetical protein SWN98_04380 [Pseudomonadota bacterium]|jgi:hypothetical protein|nr:hypothetical protein [Pseudomonadota bacterium]